MNLEDKIAIKTYLINELDLKINTLKTQILNLTIDAQNDAKGSAGDKHETGLAMMHLEQEKLSKKLEESVKQLQNMKALTIDFTHAKITFGSLIETESAIFFVSEALPHFRYQNKIILPLSTQAPIYSQLKGKTFGETLLFNGKIINIKSII